MSKAKDPLRFIHFQTLADGGEKGHWKPSPRLRKAGWTNLDLGTDRKAAILAGMARNEEVEAWEAAQNSAHPEQRPSPTRARVEGRPRWRDLVARFKADASDEGYLSKAPKTRREYDSRIKSLTLWAFDGDLILADLDRRMILDLKKVLVADGRKSRTAALLRVLSLLLSRAEDYGMIAAHPGRKLKIPKPAPRTRRLLRDQLEPLLAAADDLAMPHVALGILLGFYSMQREADLLGATGFQIRPVGDVSSDARKALSGPDGKVYGLWLQQAKTAEWVAVSLAPVARDAVAAGIAAQRAQSAVCTNLILYPGRDAHCPEWRFQRDFRAVANHAILKAWKAGDRALARLLRGRVLKDNDAIQFRDLRRSGMCWLRELHVPVPLIASISGHSIEETQKILDTYMPRDTRAAAEGMAIAVSRQAERDAADAAEREEAK